MNQPFNGRQKKDLKSLVCSIILIGALIFLYQNCADINLAPIDMEKLTCDTSAYSISRDITASNGHAVYFLRESNQEISKEYSGRIEWLVNDVVQSENIIHENRLFLDCSSHPENVRIKARFITDCRDGAEKVEDFTYPADICEPQEPPPTPGEGGILEDVSSITAGRSHTCVTFNSGATTCWGSNLRGQFGNGESGYSSLTPLRFNSLSDAQEIFSGDQHVCALRTGGKVSCWGDNSTQQIGAGDSLITSPREITGLPVSTKVSLEKENTCALAADKKVYCWGSAKFGFFTATAIPTRLPSFDQSDDIAGMLCNIVNKQVKCIVRDSLFNNIHSVTTVGASLFINPDRVFKSRSERFCATDQGKVYCWTPIRTNTSLPPVVDQISGVTNVQKLVIGRDHACALKDGRVLCWGDNTKGQLGQGNYGGSSVSAVTVSNLTGVVDIATGNDHICALLNTQRIKCWGGNQDGQLGTGDITPRNVPTDVVAQKDQPTLPPFQDNYCKRYLSSLTDDEFDSFKKYYIGQEDIVISTSRTVKATEERKTLQGFYSSFTAATGRELGKYLGIIGAGANGYYPGFISKKDYMVLSFSLPAVGEGGSSGRFSLSFQEGVGYGMWHDQLSAISPCPGDFRPQKQLSDHYLGTECRSGYDKGGGAVSGSVTGNSGCLIPKNTTMYINTSIRNLYADPITPLGTAEICMNTACGVGVLISK